MFEKKSHLKQNLTRNQETVSLPAESIKLGALLWQLDVIEEKDLRAALALSYEARIPIGKALVVGGHVPSERLRDYVTIQSLVRGRDISLGDAREVSRIMMAQSWTLKDSLIAIGCYHACLESEKSRLGELLIRSENISDGTLKAALRIQQFSDMPLGKILIVNFSLNSGVVDLALDVQRSLRAGALSESDAVETLIAGTENLVSPGTDVTHPSDLYSLLIASGASVETELSAIHNFARANNLNLVKVLRGAGLVDKRVLMAAEVLAKLEEYQKLEGEQAKSMLTRVVAYVESAGASVNSRESLSPVTFFHFLNASGFLTEKSTRELAKEIIQSISRDKQISVILDIDLAAGLSKTYVKSAIVRCLTDDDKLLALLEAMKSTSHCLISLAFGLLTTIRAGAMGMDEAIIRFASFREIYDTALAGDK